MRIECPSCAAQSSLPPDFAGLVKCDCGTRYDGFAHPAPVQHKRSVSSDLVVIAEPWRGGRNLNEPPAYALPSRSTKSRKFRYGAIACVTLLIIGGAYLLHANFGGFTKVDQAATQIEPVKAQSAETKNNPERIAFENVEFNSMGQGNYFIRAELKNTSGVIYDWPLVEVVFIAQGEEVGKKVLTPVEYLAGESAAGRTPAPSIAAGLGTPIWIHISLPADFASADSYQIKAIYQP